MAYLVVGSVLGFVMLRFPMKWWYEQSLILLSISFVVLVLVLIPGIGKRSTEVPVGSVWSVANVQSSEISRFACFVCCGLPGKASE